MATRKRQGGTPRRNTAPRLDGVREKELSEYALENLRRQREWEQGFRERIEWAIAQVGGPGRVQELAHIKSQSLQKLRKGGSRLAFFATLVEAIGVNPTWLLLGLHSEPRFRRGIVGVLPDDAIDQIAVPSRRPKERGEVDNTRRRR